MHDEKKNLGLAVLAMLALVPRLSQAASQGGGQQVVVTNSSDLSHALRNPQISLIVLDPSGQNIGGGKLSLEYADWREPAHLSGRYVIVRSVNGNPTTVDFGRLPWTIIIGANSSLELSNLVIHSYAPRSSASNTSLHYVGGLVSWPSISMDPRGVIKTYNTTEYFWSSTRYTRGDCQWRLAAELPGEGDFVTNKRSQQENITNDRGITEILESGIFQASFAVSHFRYVNGIVTPIPPPVGYGEANSEGSRNLCVPDNSSYEVISAQQYGADVVPAAIQAPPAPNKVVVAAATSGSVVIVAAALAALCAWYRLWGHVPLAASAASFFTSPRGGGAAGLEEASISLKVPEKGVVQEQDVHFVRDASGHLKELGAGAFGKVLLGRWKLSLVAIKILKEECTQHVSSNELANLRREAEMLQAMNHPAILRFYGACFTCNPMILVSEYMAGGDLGGAIIHDIAEHGNGPQRRLGWYIRGRVVLLCVARGLVYLHDCRIVHMDLKSANVLLQDKNYLIAKIADLGLSRQIAEGSLLTNSGHGTRAYMAPELIHMREERLAYPWALDMFSFGVLLHEVVTGQRPHQRRPMEPLRVPEDCPQGVADLWQACIAANPSVRPSAANVEAALKRLQSVPRLAPPSPAQAAPDPSVAASAGPNASAAVERSAGASCSGIKQAGHVLEGGAGASGAAAAEHPAGGQQAGGCHDEGQALTAVAAASSAHKPGSGEPGAADGVTQAGGPKGQGVDCARTDSPASRSTVPHSD